MSIIGWWWWWWWKQWQSKHRSTTMVAGKMGTSQPPILQYESSETWLYLCVSYLIQLTKRLNVVSSQMWCHYWDLRQWSVFGTSFIFKRIIEASRERELVLLLFDWKETFSLRSVWLTLTHYQCNISFILSSNPTIEWWRDTRARLMN